MIEEDRETAPKLLTALANLKTSELEEFRGLYVGNEPEVAERWD